MLEHFNAFVHHVIAVALAIGRARLVLGYFLQAIFRRRASLPARGSLLSD